jgi:coenzyme F420-0:L-glutamate ligase/coenzyme F420-1:gamma-L-glutamate ligase
MQGEIRIIPIRHIPEIKQRDNLASLIVAALDKQKISLEAHDIVVITQKIVSKSEGRIIDLDTIAPSASAQEIAKKHGKDSRYIELVLKESKRIVRMDHGVIISETHHGFICANAGVDESNAGAENTALLLPVNPDKSAKKIRDELQKSSGISLGVIISDTWGRPWREGQVNFAIGTSGLDVLVDYRGKKDSFGFELRASLIAIADELASAAELATGKIDAVPVVIIRGYRFKTSENGSKTLLRDPKKDLFR